MAGPFLLLIRRPNAPNAIFLLINELCAIDVTSL